MAGVPFNLLAHVYEHESAGLFGDFFRGDVHRIAEPFVVDEMSDGRVGVAVFLQAHRAKRHLQRVEQ